MSSRSVPLAFLFLFLYFAHSFTLFLSLFLFLSCSFFSLTRARIHSDAYVPTSPWLDEIRTRVSTDYARDLLNVYVACYLYIHVRDSSSWSHLHARERGNVYEGRPNPRDLCRCRRVQVPSRELCYCEPVLDFSPGDYANFV